MKMSYFSQIFFEEKYKKSIYMTRDSGTVAALTIFTAVLLKLI